MEQATVHFHKHLSWRYKYRLTARSGLKTIWSMAFLCFFTELITIQHNRSRFCLISTRLVILLTCSEANTSRSETSEIRSNVCRTAFKRKKKQLLPSLWLRRWTARHDYQPEQLSFKWIIRASYNVAVVWNDIRGTVFFFSADRCNFLTNEFPTTSELFCVLALSSITTHHITINALRMQTNELLIAALNLRGDTSLGELIQDATVSCDWKGKACRALCVLFLLNEAENRWSNDDYY